MFYKALLQAVNDWQMGGNARQKHYRGLALERAAATLPEAFRRCTQPCYRRIALDKKFTFDLGETATLKETIAAWSTDLGFVKAFKDGVPEPGWQGAIFERKAAPGEVVVNLSALYAEKEFRRACHRWRSEIECFDQGIGWYGDTQREVVLKVEKLRIREIHATGGYSSGLETITERYLGLPPTPKNLKTVDRLIRASGKQVGAWWLTGHAKDRILEFWLKRAAELAPRRQAETAARKKER